MGYGDVNSFVCFENTFVFYVLKTLFLFVFYVMDTYFFSLYMYEYMILMNGSLLIKKNHLFFRFNRCFF